ncbi:tyrosinase tyrosinase: common central domain protein, partial [Rhizoctonia solani AG-3 Rhs1AP]
MSDEFHPKAASFREIAGIHGMPYVPWPGDPDEARQTTRGSWLGYCNHASILFPSWHRPYIMVLEQIISDVAHGIASEFAERELHQAESRAEDSAEEDMDEVEDVEMSNKAEEWIDAADNLRFPFWDWTDSRTGVEGIPEIFQKEQIDLVVPQGERTTFNNPLAYYKFNHPVDGFDNRWQPFGGKVYKDSARAYYREWNCTFRNPYSRVNTADNYAGIKEVLIDKDPNRRGTWANLTNDVAGMFAFPLNIPAKLFANAPPIIRENLQLNNEQEALIALWLFELPFGSGGTWVEKNNQEVNDAYPLWPFRNSGYDYWTAQYGHSLNYYSDYDGQPTALYNKYYTYPPIEYKDSTGRSCEVKIDTDPTHPTSLKLRNKQRHYLQKHFRYDPIKARDDAQSRTKKHLISDMFTKHHRYTAGPTPSSHQVVGNYRQFFVSVSLDPTFIRGSYMLVLSIDPEDELSRPIQYEHTSSKLFEIGRVSVLSRGSSEACGNCQAQRAGGVRVRGIIMIPHQVIYDLLVTASKNDRTTRDIEVIGLIKVVLVAQLVLPNGLVHSTLDDHDPKKADRSLSGSQVPHLELLSSDVYQECEGAEGQLKDPEVPYDFEDWKSHNALHKIDNAQGEKIERRWVLEGE